MYSRSLPHWHPLFLTWRLFGGLPRRTPKIERESQEAITGKNAGKEFVLMDRALDRATRGPKWLSDHSVAECVVRAFVYGAAVLRHYDLCAYVVMSNHVHLLIRPNVQVPRITQRIKTASAREANRIWGRTGSYFWQDESFDHWAREPTEYERIRRYIENNPVAAELVDKEEDWRWSSASVEDRPMPSDRGCSCVAVA